MKNLSVTLFVIALTASGTFAMPLRAPHLNRLKRLYHDLTIDQPLDRTKLDRLVQVALEDDLLIDRQEQALLESFIGHGYTDPTGDEAPEVMTTFDGQAPKGWVARAQRLLLTALHASLLSRRGSLALRELVAIAWRSDLTGDDRTQMLELIDHYREVDTKQQSRDAMVGLSVLIANPDRARLDEAHRYQLAVLARLANSPTVLWGPGQASASSRP